MTGFKRYGRLLAAGIVAMAAAGAAAQSAEAKLPEPVVPDQIKVEPGHRLFLAADATGVQIYSCNATAAGPAWTFVAPRADLFDDRGRRIVTHFGGPTWESTKDGSQVVGALVKPVTVDAGAIPWLLLSAASTVHGKGGDLLGDTTFIQRTKTRGGLAPAAASCNAATVGTRAEVPYTADYNFWKRHGCGRDDRAARPWCRPRHVRRSLDPAEPPSRRPRRRSATSCGTMPIEGTTPTQIRAESFPDLGDEVMYPRMSAKKLERLAELGTRRSFAAGETLYEQGQRDAPFLVIERGRVRVLDRKPGKDVWVAEADAGTFLGDIATFTGEPAIAECVADEPTDVIAFDRQALRAMLASWPELAELDPAHDDGAQGVARGARARRAAADRAARFAARLRGARPARAQPHPGAVVRRRHRRRERRDARLAADPARGDAGARAQHRRAAQPLGRPGRPRARACARRSTASGSTWSCSAAAPRGSRPPCTAGPRGCGRS